MKHKLVRAFTALALLTGLGVATQTFEASGASAVGPCGTITSSSPHYFDGWYQYNTQPVYGVTTNMVYYLPTLCTGDNLDTENFGSAWAMVTNGNGWAQSGEIYSTAQSCLEHFAQSNETHTSTPSTVIYGTPNGHCAANGQNHQLSTLYLQSSGIFAMKIDTTTLLFSAFNPATSWGMPSASIKVEYYGEVRSLNSDMPGNATKQTLFTFMGWQSTPSGQLTGDCGYVGLASHTDSSRWTTAVTDCSDVSIYTSVP